MVDIVMATYNGDRYVGQQIDSILRQSYKAWQLRIRDDGSSDKTWQLCCEYASRHPEQICLTKDSLGRLGDRGNFSELLRHTESDYVMFCDQDDVWMPNKIEVTLAAMLRAEASEGASVPIGVFTDLTVTDENLRVVAPSAMRYAHRNPYTCGTARRLCVESPVYGNALMVNRASKRLCDKVPGAIPMHDWWLSMLAVVFGRLVYVDEPTLLYRRHANSLSLTTKYGLVSYMRTALKERRGFMDRLLDQWRLFYKVYGDQMDEEQRVFFSALGSINDRNWVMRRYMLLRHRMFKTGFLKNLGLFLVV